MALKLNEAYPGRFNNPSPEYPQGSFKNRTTPTAEDGSYFEQQWANDHLAFLSSLLDGAGVEANGLVDEVGSSQYYAALLQVISDASPSPVQATEVISGISRIGTQAEVNAGTLDNVAVTPAKLRGAQATQAEAEAGTDNTKISSPLRVFQALRSAAANATELLRGTLRIGTQADVNAGTLDDVAVTPKKLRMGFAVSLAQNGYVAFPTWLGGLIIQWGVTGAQGTKTWPITFPNGALSVSIANQNNDTSGITAISATGYTYAGASSSRFIAVGY